MQGVSRGAWSDLCLWNGSSHRDAPALQLCLVQLGYALFHVLFGVEGHKSKTSRPTGHLVQHDTSIHGTLSIFGEDCTETGFVWPVMRMNAQSEACRSSRQISATTMTVKALDGQFAAISSIIQTIMTDERIAQERHHHEQADCNR